MDLRRQTARCHVCDVTCARCDYDRKLKEFANSLSEEKIRTFKEMFQMFDKDGDGTISTKELGAVLRSLGLNPGQDEIDEMIEETDRDNSGAIDFREFCSLMVKREREKETVEANMNQMRKLLILSKTIFPII